MYSFIKHYEQPNKFNDELIKDIRQNDSMVEYLVDICNAQANALEWVTFDKYELLEDENKFSHKYKVPINDSRLSLITFYFTIRFKDEVQQIKMPIFIPKLIDGYYFILNGNRYYAVLQIVDSSTYNTRDSVILKSLLMPIILKSEKLEFEDVLGNTYNIKTYLLNLFKKKTNFLYYFFASFGYDGTLDYFGYKDDVEIIQLTDDYTVEENELVFPLSKSYYLRADKAKFESDKVFQSIVACLIGVFSKKTQINKKDDIEYWKIKLGQAFTTNSNSQLAKAESVLVSFKRLLDDRTRKNLRIEEKDKEDIYALIKWMIANFDDLLRMDNLSLDNKRMRLGEYLVNGFNRRVSTNTYRILNSKTLTMQKIVAAFNIPPGIILNELQTSELMRYSNAVNDMDLFTAACKYSNRGPSSLGEGSKKTVSSIYRSIHISHIGRLSLSSCSASDPGMSGVISPFIRTEGLYFNTEDIGSMAIDDDDFDDMDE